ncbi:MAG: hypothetical protein KKC80_04895 [Candidatus Margulisbacteria bacterium]|nr:hypothetical protein [Candidatus Margulisiibacteriota bacterium]MBU1616669.1 hypothetical protein [Candidatus Margulisiibacteriota bacterium]MBU1867199.1 hypothetical protein [Candidatus Margulisiibacteriota bacterium]
MSSIFYFDLIGKIISAVSLISLAAIIYLNNRASLPNRNIAATFVFLALWVLSLVVRMFDPNPADQIYFSRFSHLFGAVAIAVFSYSIISFPDEKDLPPLIKWGIIGTGLLFGLLAVFTDHVLSGYQAAPPPFIYLGEVLGGPLYPLFLVYWGTLPILAVLRLLSKYVQSRDQERVRIGYLLAALIIGVANVTFFNIFLPYYGPIDTTSVGPILVILPVIIIAYSIFKHGLFKLNPKIAADEIINALGEMVIIYDLNGQVVYCGNKQYIFKPEEAQEIIRLVIEKDRIYGKRMRLRDRWVDISAMFLPHGGGVVVVVYDLTSLEKEIVSEQFLQREIQIGIERETILRKLLASLATTFEEEALSRLSAEAKMILGFDEQALPAIEKMVARAKERSILLHKMESDRQDLEKRIGEIEQIQRQGVQRELKMIELKKKISELEEKIK